jgi:pimeloyl-ACP methyl ester carboxylesterase
VTAPGIDLAVNGRRLHALRLAAPDGREGPTLVFLHEALGSIAQWKSFPAHLCAATGLPGFVYERWGFGKSEPKGPGPWPADYLEREAATLDDVLAAAGIRRPVLFGHSDGGTIALLYAAAFPGKVEALISEAAHVLVEEVTLAGIRGVVESTKDGRLLRGLHRYHGEKTADVFSGWADTWLAPGFRDWNIVGRLSAIRRPLLVLQGTEDQFGTEVQVDSICRSVSGPVDSRYFEGAGHVPHLEAGEAVAREAHRFLAGCGVPVSPLQSPKPGI